MNGHAELSSRVTFMPSPNLTMSAGVMCSVSMPSSRPLTLTPLMCRSPFLAARWAANRPAMIAISDSSREMPPATSGARRKPPRFSQYSRLSSHLNLPSGVM